MPPFSVKNFLFKFCLNFELIVEFDTLCNIKWYINAYYIDTDGGIQ